MHATTSTLLDAAPAEHPVPLSDAAETPDASLEEYACIGFASGIYYSKFHRSVTDLAEKKLPEGKKVFFLYTCGARKDSYTAAVTRLAGARGCDVLGEYGALGYDTFGPFKLVGGIAKGHPDGAELEGAVQFYETILKSCR